MRLREAVKKNPNSAIRWRGYKGLYLPSPLPFDRLRTGLQRRGRTNQDTGYPIEPGMTEREVAAASYAAQRPLRCCSGRI